MKKNCLRTMYNIADLNERTFKPNDPSVLKDNENRYYRPKSYNSDENTWLYHCRIDPKKDIDTPVIGDTIILKENHTTNVCAIGIVEECYFRRPCNRSISKDVKHYVSSTVGVVVLRPHPNYKRPLKFWHKN